MAKRGRKAGTSAVPANESKAQKFQRLASKRMTKVLNGIDGLAKLAGTGYESTEAQQAKMFNALKQAVEACYTRFQRKGRAASKEGFTF